MSKKVPQEVVAAARKLENDPECEHDEIDENALMDFKVYSDRVVLVIATGQKYTVSRDGLMDWFKEFIERVKESIEGKKSSRTRKKSV